MQIEGEAPAVRAGVTAQIVFLGAEFTHVFAHRHDKASRAVPGTLAAAS